MSANTSRTPKKSTPDFATFAGLIFAVLSLLGGLLLEGGRIGDVAQWTAALIVLGGTLGAVLVTTPLSVFWDAVRKLPSVFLVPPREERETTELLLGLAAKARKGGMASLDEHSRHLSDRFLRKSLEIVADGVGVPDIREIMELEIDQEQLRWEAEVRVYEAASGYAPTVGIIGAVMGLIQVMKHLDNMEEVGRGIAVAFVATVYGVALANLFLLPAANKLKAAATNTLRLRELMLEGVIGIAEGINPRLIQVRLEAYQPQTALSRKAPVAAKETRNAA